MTGGVDAIDASYGDPTTSDPPSFPFPFFPNKDIRFMNESLSGERPLFFIADNGLSVGSSCKGESRRVDAILREDALLGLIDMDS